MRLLFKDVVAYMACYLTRAFFVWPLALLAGVFYAIAGASEVLGDALKHLCRDIRNAVEHPMLPKLRKQIEALEEKRRLEALRWMRNDLEDGPEA